MKNKQPVIALDTILFIIFLILKLDGAITWKWIWVFSPLWIGWLIAIIFVVWVKIYIAKDDYKESQKINRDMALGNRLVWDSKSGKMYGYIGEDTECL